MWQDKTYSPLAPHLQWEPLKWFQEDWGTNFKCWAWIVLLLLLIPLGWGLAGNSRDVSSCRNSRWIFTIYSHQVKYKFFYWLVEEPCEEAEKWLYLLDGLERSLYSWDEKGHCVSLAIVYGVILGSAKQPDDMVGMRPFGLRIILRNLLTHLYK